MAQRCARCDSLATRQSIKAPAAWVDVLGDEHGVDPVGTLVVPLCRDCYAEARDVPKDDGEAAREFLADLNPDHFVDEVTG